MVDQERLDLLQDIETLDYGIKSLGTVNYWRLKGVHKRQVGRAMEVAISRTGKPLALNGATIRELKRLKDGLKRELNRRDAQQQIGLFP